MPQQRTNKQKAVVFVIGLLATLYLINPTLGVFEFLPDNIPLIGNVDEATATFLLLSSLAYFGYKIPFFFEEKRQRQKSDTTRAKAQPEAEEGEVIDE